MTTIIENAIKADYAAANAVHAGVSASWEGLMPLLLADDQKAPNEHADMFMVRQFARLQFSDTVDLRAEYKKRFFVPCPEYITRDDLIFELIKRIHLEHYTPDAVCTDLNTDDPVEYALRSKRAYLWVPIRRSASRFYNTIPFYTDGHSMLHLIKLSVGTENLADLAEWQRERLAELRRNGKRPELVHVTRHMPKQADELLAGGSIYWVVKGFVIARQKLLDLRRIEISGVPHCAIVLDHNLVPVRSQPRRAFQGWRYLGAEDAPPDMAAGSGHEDLPEHLRHELRALGLL